MHIRKIVFIVLTFVASQSFAADGFLVGDWDGLISRFEKHSQYEDYVVVASQANGVAEELIWGVIMVENGAPGLESRNTNGSYDLGIMQINDSAEWFPILEAAGFSRNDLRDDPFANIMAGAYILSSEIRQANGDWYTGVMHYHSRTKRHKERYIQTFLPFYTALLEMSLINELMLHSDG